MSRQKRREQGYTNQSAATQSKPSLVPVICPRPVFESVSDKLNWEYAVESNPRRPGESLLDWMARVSADVAKVPAQLPLSERGSGA